MGNEWSSSGLRSCQLEEKVELPVGSTRKCLPWQLYRAVSTDAGSGRSPSAFVYSLNADSAGSDNRHVTRSDIAQAAENNAKVVPRKCHFDECFVSSASTRPANIEKFLSGSFPGQSRGCRVQGQSPKSED